MLLFLIFAGVALGLMLPRTVASKRVRLVLGAWLLASAAVLVLYGGEARGRWQPLGLLLVTGFPFLATLLVTRVVALDNRPVAASFLVALVFGAASALGVLTVVNAGLLSLW